MQSYSSYVYICHQVTKSYSDKQVTTQLYGTEI